MKSRFSEEQITRAVRQAEAGRQRMKSNRSRSGVFPFDLLVA